MSVIGQFWARVLLAYALATLAILSVILSAPWIHCCVCSSTRVRKDFQSWTCTARRMYGALSCRTVSAAEHVKEPLVVVDTAFV